MRVCGANGLRMAAVAGKASVPTPEHSNKAAFLQRVRHALGRSKPIAYPPDHPPLRANSTRQAEKVRTTLARNEARREQSVRRLAEAAAAASWNVQCVDGSAEAAAAVAAIARNAGYKRIVRSAEDVFTRVDVDAALRDIGVSPTVLASLTRSVRRTSRRAELKDLAFKADMGVTGVSYAIVETASCAVIPRKGVARLTSLAPPVLALLVEAEQIVETLDDFFAIMRLNTMQSRTHGPNYFNFISGPSRTADIEQTLTVGVHGPGEVHMVIFNRAPSHGKALQVDEERRE